MANELQTFAFTVSPAALPTAGTVSVSSAGDTDTLSFSDFASAAALETKLQDFTDLAGNVAVTDLGGFVYRIEFINGLANTNVNELTKASDTLQSPADAVDITKTVAGVAGVSEVQTITFSASPSGGSWTINGVLVANGAAAAASDVEAAIEDAGGANLPCAVTGSFPVFTVTATAYGNISDTLLTIDTSALTRTNNCGIAIATTQTGGTGVNEIHELSVTTTPLGGTYDLTVNSTAVNGIAYNTDNTTLQGLINAALGGGATVVVTGGTFGIAVGDPMSIQFTGTLEQTDVGDSAVDGSSLQSADITADVDTDTQGVTQVKTKQRVTIVADAGTFTLSSTSPSFTTGSITAAGVDAAAIQTALTAQTIPTTCTDIGAGIVDVEFDFNGDAALMTADSSALLINQPLIIDTTQEGSAAAGGRAGVRHGLCRSPLVRIGV